MVGVAITILIVSLHSEILASDTGGVSNSNCSEVTMSPNFLDFFGREYFMSVPSETPYVPLTEGQAPCMRLPSCAAESKESACEKAC